MSGNPYPGGVRGPDDGEMKTISLPMPSEAVPEPEPEEEVAEDVPPAEEQVAEVEPPAEYQEFYDTLIDKGLTDIMGVMGVLFALVKATQVFVQAQDTFRFLCCSSIAGFICFYTVAFMGRKTFLAHFIILVGVGFTYNVTAIGCAHILWPDHKMETTYIALMLYFIILCVSGVFGNLSLSPRLEALGDAAAAAAARARVNARAHARAHVRS